MKFERLLELVSNEPLFETGLLLAGDVDPRDVRRQLSRWVRAGRVLQVRRGLYLLAPPYRKGTLHPFLTANLIHRPSYVSLVSALAHHGLIPEYAPAVTSITTARPGEWETPVGSYFYRHVRLDLFRGFDEIEVLPGRKAFIATPEKAIVDIIYLTRGADSAAYLEGLRLQNLDRIDTARLNDETSRSGSAKVARAVRVIAELTAREAREFEKL